MHMFTATGKVLSSGWIPFGLRTRVVSGLWNFDASSK